MITLLFSLNIIAHIISYNILKEAKASNVSGVLVFAFVNALLAILYLLDIEWIKWLILIILVIGGLGLLFTTILKGKGKWIDYTILLLDTLIIYNLLIYNFL